MSTREHFSYFITCIRCGNEGELCVSEDDYPFMRNPNRAVEEVEGEFTAEVIDGQTVQVTCQLCNTTFQP
jgi:hypothetical protein